MINLSGEILTPLVSLYVILFVILFVFLKETKYENSTRFLLGMLIGVITYGLLMYGSTFPKFEIDTTSYDTLAAAAYGGGIYGMLIFYIGWSTITAIVTKKYHKPGLFAGISISFVIFELYFAIKCVETIPFMSNVVEPMC